MHKIRNLVVLLSSLIVFYGCAAAWFAAGGIATLGGYKYIEGQLTREYPVEFNEAWNATNSALEHLRISISNSMKDGGTGEIEAIRKDGIKTIISLQYNGVGVTTISVRVGTIGNREEAEHIHKEIASAVKKK